MRTHSLMRTLGFVALGILAAAPAARASVLDEQVYGPFPVRLAAAERPDSPQVTEAERVSREVVRTDRILDEVGAKVGRTHNDKAKADLENARSRQDDAKSALTSNQFARAMRLTLEARAFGKSSLIKVGPADQDPDYVARALDHTDDALDRADELLDDVAGQAAHRRFDSLKGQQKKARQIYKDGDFPASYSLTRKVRDGVLDLLRQIADLPVSEDTAKRALRRAERAFTQADEDLGRRPTAQARRLEQAARVQMEKARSSYNRGSYRDALLHAKLVERNLELAIDAERVATSRSE